MARDRPQAYASPPASHARQQAYASPQPTAPREYSMANQYRSAERGSHAIRPFEGSPGGNTGLPQESFSNYFAKTDAKPNVMFNGVPVQPRFTRYGHSNLEPNERLRTSGSPYRTFISSSNQNSNSSLNNVPGPRVRIQTINNTNNGPSLNFNQGVSQQYSPRTGSIINFQGFHATDLARENQLNTHLNSLTTELALVFLEEEILWKKRQEIQQASKTPTSDNSSALLAKRTQLTNQIKTVDSNCRVIDNQIADIRRRNDAMGVKRRYLLSKQSESSAGSNQTRVMQSNIASLRDSLRDTTIQRETYKFSIISDLEKSMRGQAEIEAMKAARQSTWAIEDNEGSQLAERVDALQRMLEIKA